MIQILHQPLLVDHHSDYSDFTDEEPSSPNSSSDSSRTIGNTPPQSDFETSSLESTQDMAIVINDDEEDKLLCPPGHRLDRLE